MLCVWFLPILNMLVFEGVCNMSFTRGHRKTQEEPHSEHVFQK